MLPFAGNEHLLDYKALWAVNCLRLENFTKKTNRSFHLMVVGMNVNWDECAENLRIKNVYWG